MIAANKLSDLPFFADLEPATLELLAPLAEHRSAKAGERFFDEGAPSRHLRVLIKGLVSLRLKQDEEDHDVAMGTFDKPGDVIGISALVVEKGVHPYTAVCLEDCEVVELDARRLLEVCESRPQSGYAILRRLTNIMGERLATAREQIRSRVRPGLISHG